MRYRDYYCTPKLSEGDNAYYGDVEGAPEIPMIEAETIDDFERLFHEAVDDYLDRQHTVKPNTNWGLIISLVAIVGIIVVAIASCPKKPAHVAFLTDRINVIVAEELGQHGGGGDLAPLGLMLGNVIVSPIVEKSLNVYDYFLFSVGKISINGQENTVTVGAFGHFFSASKEHMKQALKDNTYMKDYLNLLK